MRLEGVSTYITHSVVLHEIRRGQYLRYPLRIYMRLEEVSTYITHSVVT